MSSSELVPSKSTKMSSGFTICTSHVTGPPRMQENHEKSEDPKKNKANLLWVKKKKTSGNPQGEREFTYPSCGIVYVVAWPVSQRSAYETSY